MVPQFVGATLRGRPFLSDRSQEWGAHGGTPLQIKTLLEPESIFEGLVDLGVDVVCLVDSHLSAYLQIYLFSAWREPPNAFLPTRVELVSKDLMKRRKDSWETKLHQQATPELNSLFQSVPDGWFGSSFAEIHHHPQQVSTDADDGGGEAYTCTGLSRPDPQGCQFRPTFSRRPGRRSKHPHRCRFPMSACHDASARSFDRVVDCSHNTQ